MVSGIAYRGIPLFANCRRGKHYADTSKVLVDCIPLCRELIKCMGRGNPGSAGLGSSGDGDGSGSGGGSGGSSGLGIPGLGGSGTSSFVENPRLGLLWTNVTHLSPLPLPRWQSKAASSRSICKGPIGPPCAVTLS